MKATTNTHQQLARTETEQPPKGERGGEVGPSLAWRAAFRAQATPDMMDDVIAYAAKRASWLERQTGRKDPGSIEEMIQDAIGDTFAGVVTWEPERLPLALHLKGVIRSRLSHEIERLAEHRHVRLHEVPEVEVSAALATCAAPSSGSELDAFADAFTARLREGADGDEPVLTLIDLYREGITDRRDVCRLGRMSVATYHNAHRRLKRLVDNLPESQRVAAIAAMA